MKLKEIPKFMEEINKYKHKCTKCGHTFVITKQKPKILCTFCGTYNYYDKSEEFKDKLKKSLKNQKNIL